MATDFIKEGLEQVGQKIIDQMVDTLFENKSVITGNLARSLSYEIQTTKDGYKLLILDNSGKGGYDYGLSVDQGRSRGPGKMPPVKPIKDWIKRRGINPPQGMSVESFAFVIARSIGKKGQKFKQPKPFIQPSVEMVTSRFLPEILQDKGVMFINQELENIK